MPKSRRGLKGFFSEVKREMKKVSWPTKKETNRLTGVVLVVCGICMAILWALSFGFGAIVNMITKGGA